MKLSEMRMKVKGKIRVASPVRGIAKVGRNDRCICGSDKKFKKCCWSKYEGYDEKN